MTTPKEKRGTCQMYSMKCYECKLNANLKICFECKVCKIYYKKTAVIYITVCVFSNNYLQ